MQELITKTQIRLTFINGFDEEGNPNFVQRNFTNIDPAVINEKIKQFAESYAQLTSLDYQYVTRINEVSIN